MSLMRIVVVEDHPVLCEAIVTALAEVDDFDVVGVCDEGATAVSLVLGERPDVVVMDVRLRGLDGIEATRRIVNEWPQVRIVVHTAAEDVQPRLGREPGVASVVEKSVDPDHLIEAIWRVLGRDTRDSG